ncbi:MAG TPA: hypothetical protein VHN11_00190 [Xanthobacteraceae bacterium]|jgi:hypothetical protein|nr:hypothetical protein [Xanthobacteraceae bacterium]
MVARNHRFTAAIAACVVFVSSIAPAGAANLLELNFWLSGPRYDGVIPPCDTSFALSTIQHRFATKEGRFWQSGLRIEGFERIHEVAFRPWAPHTVPRRFCSGTAFTSDGKKRRVDYWIGEDTGMIGGNWGVEWCVAGTDRNWAYNPSCRMARP